MERKFAERPESGGAVAFERVRSLRAFHDSGRIEDRIVRAHGARAGDAGSRSAQPLKDQNETYRNSISTQFNVIEITINPL